jgi:uncharacterized protein
MRVVLVALLVGVILWWLSARSSPHASKESRKAHEPQAFARCAHCGVHLPVSDALMDRGIAYCSEAHRLAGPRDRGAS